MPAHRATFARRSFDSALISNGLPRLRICLAALEDTYSAPSQVVYLVPRNRYLLLNGYFSNYVSRLQLPGRTANELTLLSYRLMRAGYGFVGDVIQMTPQQIGAYAATVSAVRHPTKIVVQVQNAISRNGLMLGMQAPGWTRVEEPSLEERIIKRDARNDARRSSPKLQQAPYLTLVR